MLRDGKTCIYELKLFFTFLNIKFYLIKSKLATNFI